VEGPIAEPSAPRQAEVALLRSPSYELFVAFVVSIIPHAAALFVGGYGQIITNAPLAVVITIVDAVAVVIAYLQFRDDSHARRSSHWLVWATIAIGAVWLIYAIFVGAVILLGRVFCISQDCRGPIR
jgi:nitrate reductase NapE component